jgi:hypothetical protein
LASKVAPIAVDRVSMPGDLRSTVTLSLSVAIVSTTSRVAVKPGLTWTSSRFNVLKPARVKTRRYSPGGMAGNRKKPSPLVTILRVPMRASLEIVTVTPGNMAPVLSAT